MFPPNTKVLVVDDFKTMRKLVINALSTMGITSVVESEDAADAWPLVEQSYAKNEPFGLIVSDWNMPKMQGIDFLRKVRENAASKDIPFLMVTAEAEQKNIIEAVKIGVSNYIVKPFSPATFKEKVEQVWKKHHP